MTGLFSKPYADAVAKLRVPFGFVMVAAFALLAAPTVTSLSWGLPLAFCGLLLRAWAAGHLRKNQSLASSGPYAYTRNPLYLGTLTVALGFAVAARRVELAVLFGAVFLLVYLPVVELESQHLRKLFPGYEAYARRVPMLLPHFKPIPATGKFDLRVYWKNEEYNALAGFLAGTALLFWKLLG